MSYKKTLVIAGLGFIIAGSCLAMTFSGCAAFPLLPANERFVDQETKFRKEYQANRSQNAMRWLLTNSVKQGMTQKSVNETLGQEGEHIRADSVFKRGTSAYRRDDETYRYGPDAEGRSIYLMFRNNKLVNYDAEEFE